MAECWRIIILECRIDAAIFIFIDIRNWRWNVYIYKYKYKKSMLQYLYLKIDAAANIVWIKIGVISSPSLNLRWDLCQVFLQPFVNLNMWTENMCTIFCDHVYNILRTCEQYFVIMCSIFWEHVNNILRTCVQYFENMWAIFCDHVFNILKTCVQYFVNMVEMAKVVKCSLT